VKANYFQLDNLCLTAEELKEHQREVIKYADWIRYGNNRFAIYCSVPAFTSESPEMKSVCNKFVNPKDVIKRIEYNYVEPMAFILPHTDNDRNVVINIPILGDFENSYIDFYETDLQNSIPTDANYKGETIKSTAKTFDQPALLTQLNYTRPICFDSQEVHGVTSHSKDKRYILTISIADKYTFKDIYRMYLQGHLLTLGRGLDSEMFDKFLRI
jgi:hypothetical protein